MFEDRSDRFATNPPFQGYGVAVTPAPDGPRAYVTGFGRPNRFLTWRDGEFVDVACGILADEGNHALGVAAADLDEDGREEIYVHNGASFGGVSAEPDLLLDPEGGRWTDLFSHAINDGRGNRRVGRSVAAVDRFGTGRYGIFVTGYGAPARFYELGDDREITDLAEAIGLDVTTGGRTLVPGPIVTERMDVFVGVERGPNLLLRNEDGRFVDVAAECGVADPHGHARGATLVSPDGDPRFDLACGNWQGENRLFERTETGFRESTPPAFATPGAVRTVVSADFDNDGDPELFVNCLGERNRLFAPREGWTALDPGAATEPHGYGTGAAVADFDDDGTLELLVVHGESEAQPLSLYAVPNDGDWLRIRPTTPAGAPARGARVTLDSSDGRQTRLVDAGSGYLCQMEPVAHFGLGSAAPERVTVRWPDGRERTVDDVRPRTTLDVPHPSA
jgi:hypothetical protein